jgi:regulator of protease activity HflC (stomatin/prohibitin superfamily)
MTTRSFKTTLEPPVTPGGTCFVEIPFDVREVFGRARPPVNVTVNGHTHPSTVAVYGGRYYVPARQSVRDAAAVTPGSLVDVTVALDTSVRSVTPPPDLAAALAKNRRARDGWDACSFTHKKEHADAITGAKRPETRARRVEAAVEMLVALAEKRASKPAKKATKAKAGKPGAPRRRTSRL